MTRKLPTYPHKRCTFGETWGRTSCEPNFSTLICEVPTNGSGRCACRDCNGTLESHPSLTSNAIAYMQTHNWGIELLPTTYMFEQYPAELATKGAGNTAMDLFKTIYIDGITDKYNIPWWLNMSAFMANWSEFTYQTPCYTSSFYKPATGMQPSYDAAYGKALTFILNNCAKNLQGIEVESIYTNGLTWLREATNVSISQKYWNTGFNDWDSHYVPILNGTDQTTGKDLNPQPTAMQHLALLDELVMEVYINVTKQPFFDSWVNGLPAIKAAYPNLPVVMNADCICAWSQWDWTNNVEIETGTDNGWWAPQGAGEPSSRCYTERLGALQMINRLRELNGGAFSAVCWNGYRALYPYSGQSYPDLSWHLDFVESMNLTVKPQTAEINMVVS